MKFIVFSVIAMIMLSGCATRSDFTALSAKNISLTNLKVKREMVKGNTSGEHCQHTVIFFPLSGPATLDEALDRALEPHHANLLLNAVVKHNWFYIPFIYGQNCWKVNGVAYDTY
ncbi:MAG: hypothetical protein ACXW1W_11815 [Methylococcaceae bacterium]